MSLAALDKNGIKQISYSLQPEQYRQDWICPLCRQPMLFVNGKLKIQHFRHVAYNHCESEPETVEHINLKKFIYSWLTNAGYQCEYEVKIGNRQADVTFLNRRTGKLRVVECQVSLISTAELHQRNFEYKQEKVYEVYWIMYPQNYLVPYRDYDYIFRLKEVEREYLNSSYFLYFDPVSKQVKKLYFRPKRMRGGGMCETIFLKEKDELVIENKQFTNWGMIDNWVKARQSNQN